MSDSNGVLSREQIDAKATLATRHVWIDEWQGHVCVRELTGDERFYLTELLANGQTKDGKYQTREVERELVRLSLCDPQSLEPLYKKAEVAKLMEKSGRAIDRIEDAAEEMNRIFAGEQQRSDDEKKSDSGANSVNGTASQPSSA